MDDDEWMDDDELSVKYPGENERVYRLFIFSDKRNQIFHKNADISVIRRKINDFSGARIIDEYRLTAKSP